MEFELDKEMDSLLRHEARRGLFVVENSGSHLDVDEISAFAENALPRMARARATEHLADCDKCRRSLVNLIQLNSEAESETIHIENSRTVTVAAPEDSWFKRLFAFPKAAFAMTAMVLLMTGAIAFVALRSLNSEGQSMAKLEPTPEAQSDINAVSSKTEAELKDSSNSAAANSPNAVANTSAPSTNTTANSNPGNPLKLNESDEKQPFGRGPSATPADDTLLTRNKELPNAPVVTDGLVKSNEPAQEAKPLPQEEKIGEVSGERANSVKQDNNLGNADQNFGQNRGMSPDTQNSKRYPAPQTATVPRAQNEQKDKEESRKDVSASSAEKPKPEPAKKKSAPETRSVGGKTFRNVGGVWTDTAFGGGGTTSVRRGSDEFKKLDSGLQSIGNSFGGTVIVVWGGKAYRIQ